MRRDYPQGEGAQSLCARATGFACRGLMPWHFLRGEGEARLGRAGQQGHQLLVCLRADAHSSPIHVLFEANCLPHSDQHVSFYAIYTAVMLYSQLFF